MVERRILVGRLEDAIEDHIGSPMTFAVHTIYCCVIQVVSGSSHYNRNSSQCTQIAKGESFREKCRMRVTSRVQPTAEWIPMEDKVTRATCLLKSEKSVYVHNKTGC